MSTPAPFPLREAASPRGAWAGAAAAVLTAILAEIAIVIVAALNIVPVREALAAHVGVFLSLGLGVIWLSPRRGGSPGLLLFAICTLAMGPLGALGCGLTNLLRRSYALQATPFEEWYAALFPKVTRTRTQALYRRVVLHGGGPPKRSTVAPFLDIIAHGTVQQKRVVIAMIADAFDPAFAPALRSALNDAESAIRVQAATAVALIEGGFLNRAMALRARRAAHPRDADVILELARHHEEYATSGLLDDARMQAELSEALACCECVGKMRPGDAFIAEITARLLLSLGRLNEAMLRLQPFVARPDPSPGALASYFSCLFRRGQFARLREVCREFGACIDPAALPDGVGEALRLWSEAAAIRAVPDLVAPGGYHEAA
jgi:polysaccharide biosynthesis protein PelE